MTKSIDFYFDFISPYSYIAHKQIIKLNKRNNFNYKPILLGGLHNLGGITAPAFNERKMKNMKNDCLLISAKNNIPFKWNEKFPINSLYLMRGFLFIDENKKEKFIDCCFDAYWKDNIDILNEDNIKKILSKCEIDKKTWCIQGRFARSSGAAVIIAPGRRAGWRQPAAIPACPPARHGPVSDRFRGRARACNRGPQP